MIALEVIAGGLLGEHLAELTFAEEDPVVEALGADGPHEPLGAALEIRAPRREAHDAHARGLEHLPERACEGGVAIQNEEAPRYAAISKEIDVPSPSWLSSTTRPPWTSATRRTNGRPNPVPPSFVV